jgi:NAD(P)-dependent dehydrogenase (short-subunit alcohol dehydrogenase family)
VDLNGRVAVITGGAQGIGLALCERFAREGAHIVVADLDGERAQAVAARLGGIGLRCDVGIEAQVQSLVAAAVEHYGRIDLFCSNAGVMVSDRGGVPYGADDAGWTLSWQVNVMAHVYAARAAVPQMRAQGGGYLLQMVSAAGFLNQIGAAPYTATKHAALAFTEALAVDLADSGIKVSAICPLYVATAMIELEASDTAPEGVLSPADVAEAVLQGVQAERFLIFPHAEVPELAHKKLHDSERYLAGMRRLRAQVLQSDGSIDWAAMHRIGKGRR